jgi:CheY-like chemotaxis protein
VKAPGWVWRPCSVSSKNTRASLRWTARWEEGVRFPSICLRPGFFKNPRHQDNLQVLSSGKLPEKGSGTILGVDDEEYILNADKAILNELGYEVLLANGGREAIRVFEENKERINLLILDLIMPDLGGEIVYDRIKSSRPDMRVILSSGYSIEGQAATLLKKAVTASFKNRIT